ncbi:MAG TPA: hypothetical protein VHX37_02115 [Acidobacteriaceae bacterium]|jgi:hypothetical protein|nr:hypothetical protein [Acidobacteriaceae bacterium]
MSSKKIVSLFSLALLAAAAGCHKNSVDPSAFKSALNAYYSASPVCVWSATVKFPAQADTNNEDQTKGFDVLTDVGMLTRTPEQKKRFLIGSKQVNDYDLSGKGRSTWTPDRTQPGYGNFCFGHWQVTSVDSYTPPDDPDAAQYAVSYHDAVSTVPDWANSVEMKTAFPRIAAATSGQHTGTATLVKSSNGWQVTNVTPAPTGNGAAPNPPQ